MFIKNFSSEQEWQNFIQKYTDQREKGAGYKKSSDFLTTLVADENIWPFLMGSFFSHVGVPLLVITSTYERASQLGSELKILLKNSDVNSSIITFPSIGNNIFYKDRSDNAENLPERLKVIENILEFNKNKNQNSFIILSSVNALISLMPESKIELLDTISLATGKDYDRERLISALVNKGYQRVHKVYDKGEFSVKGSIIDIFDLSKDNPLRIDFLGDTVERILSYDIYSQEKISDNEKISIFPNLNPWEITKDLQHLKSDKSNNNKLSILGLMKTYVKSFGLIICDPLEVYLKIRSDIDMLLRSFDRDEKNLVIPDRKIVGSFIVGKNFLEDEHIKLRLNLVPTGTDPDKEKNFTLDGIKEQKKSFGNSRIFIQNLKKDIGSGKKVVVCLSDRQRRKKVEEILLDNLLSYQNFSGEDALSFKHLKPHIINFLEKELYRGYESECVSLYGEVDIYEQASGKNEQKTISYKPIEEFKPGDFIVHKTHGIGKYRDIISRQMDGCKREYFLIEYANNDKLYIPTWQADRIHRYIGESNPKITPLDSKYWNGLKKKVRKSVHKLAIDLAKLYAERERSEGFSFPQDSPWQKEIEDLFPFRETKDQKKAIEYVKNKMQDSKPMDVLVCGDVGFGKTEVAVRSAFKAIEGGKQVLMLVPTTILADQHYSTFKDRYKNYPVIVEVLSRFKTKKEQNKVVHEFREGKIDMLIGTHRILQDDIKPKDLGLLITDEEQRFGVNSKEKIKLLKKEVDSLTLTATPIPRTLYMSLTGIRDMVLITTYPEGRRPIETFVGEKEKNLIQRAIKREMARGGQVYYVSNKVRGIENIRENLQNLVPQARIAIAHGQMTGKRIEQIMEDFLNKKFDVLVTTSIIESGMDIGSVNTLIVENSHRFGLSQLYQLRGRVGRSSEKAYAYFFYPSREYLNYNALQRLKTLAEYTELGSGYDIAMKDLEIRGAGELLGARQHGHINSVGFDMYCQIIKEEVEKLKGNIVEEDINVQIDLPVSAYIPKNYIKHERDRINIYKMLGNADNFEKISSIRKNIEERYGKLPVVVENLIKIAKIKYLMKKARIERLSYIKSSREIILEKVSIKTQNLVRINSKNKNLVYKPRHKKVMIKNIYGNINLDLVLRNINDIIGAI